jgi:hypothetical protein
MLWSTGIRSLIGFGTKRMALALKLFRGEPAISEFVWHITSTHTSSPNFATLVGSGLHELLDSLHPGHG